MMDSTTGEDPTLPINFDESTNMSRLPDVTAGPDINMSNFGEHFPESNGVPALQKIGSGRLSPVRTHTMKDYEQQISELKKENFSLKLRIYFMEERLQQNFNDDAKTNIELRVEVESLKNDLREKQQLLIKASNAVESLAHEKDSIVEKLTKEKNQKAQMNGNQLQEELRKVKDEAGALKSANEQLQEKLEEAELLQQRLSGNLQDKSLQTQAALDNNKESLAEKDRIINQLNQALKSKDDVIDQMDKEKAKAHAELKPKEDELRELRQQCVEREEEIQALKDDMEREKSDKDVTKIHYKELYLEQEKRLMDLEAATESMQDKLKDKDKAIKDMQNKLKKAQQEVKDGMNKLRENERQLQQQESNVNKRDRAIQGLTEAVQNKDEEIKHLCDQIEDQEDALAKAREKLHKAERSKHEGLENNQSTISDLETKVAEMRGSLRAKDLENDRLQKALVRRQEEIASLREEQGSGDSQMEKLLANKDKAIQDLKDQLQDARDQMSGRVGSMEQHYQDLLDDAQQQIQNKERANQRLTDALQKKDQVIKDAKESKDKTVDRLKEILQQRDKELEDALEEKFIALQAKEDEIRQIRQALRERDKEMERLNNDLLHDNDRINGLESELKEKEAKSRQLANSLKAKNDSMNNAEEGHQRAISEKDSIIRKLQHALADKDRLSEEISSLGSGSPREEESNAIIRQLSQRLRNKDKMMEEMMSERAEAAEANDKATQDLLASLQDKDKQVKALHDRHNKLIADKNEIIKALQREIANKDMDIQSVEDTLTRSQQDQSILLGKMRAAMAEKDKTIEKLVKSGQEKDRLFQDMQRSTPPPVMGPDLNAMKNEIGRLRREIKARDAALNELRANSVSKDHLQALENDLDTKNDLLLKARETINALQQNQKDDRQAKLETAKLRRKVIELESELEAKQDNIDALVHAGKVKDNIIQELRLQQPKHMTSSHDTIVVGSEPNDQLYQALAAQVREMENLNKALQAERQLYVNITHNGDSKNTTHNDAFEFELAAVQSLRKQLEQALKRNNRMRENLERQISSQTLSDLESESTNNDNEVQALRDRLEESQRWNADLQSRVNELQQRGGGVGSDADSEVVRVSNAQPQPFSRPPPDEEIISAHNVDVMSPKELKDEVMRLQLQLLEANRRSLDDDLRSIPGQEETLPGTAQQAKKEIEELKEKNRELEQQVKVLEQQLASTPGRGDGVDETESHVIPVLKQQLDQAKSLLQDKDTLLQEKEQQNQALRHHLGIGPESPIQPGRNVMATLQRENAQLASQLHKAQHQKKDLQDEMEGLESQLREAEKISSAMQKQLKTTTENMESASLVPILKQQLGQAKEVIQERESQNKALQQALKKRSQDKNRLGQMEAENDQLKAQLVSYNNELQKMKSQFQALEKELEEVENSRPPPSAHAEIERLQKQLRNAENLNELLKRHIDLNSLSEGDQPSFNPELIVEMAKEIERLKDTLDEAQQELSTDSPLKTRVGKRVKTLDDTAYGALTKQLEQAHNDLHDLKKRYKQLNSKLQATEGTVRQQSDRIKRYRTEMQNAGLQPPRTPKRYHSDSNLLRAHFDQMGHKLSSASLLSPDDRSGSASPSPEYSLMADIPLSEFGQTNDIGELKSQVDTLKLHLQRSRRALRSLQNRLRSRSNTSSPTRSTSPSRTDSIGDGSGTWFELVANQQAFEKLQQEVENLREQVEEANNVNMTLQEHNNDLMEKVRSNIPVPPGLLAHNEQLIKENEAEIALLKQQLEDSRQLCATLREMIDDTLSAMEEISRRMEDEKENSPSEVEKTRQKMKKSKIVAEDLQKVLEEHKKRSGDSSGQMASDILENRRKDGEIRQLKMEIKQRKEINKKLRDILGENKKSAEETRHELERLAKEVQEKNETLTNLRRQVRHLQAMGSFSPNSHMISETEDTSSMQFQTTANTDSMLPEEDADATDTESELPFDSSRQQVVGIAAAKERVSSGGESQDTVRDRFEQFSDPIDQSQRYNLPKVTPASRLKRGQTIGRTKTGDDESSEAAVQTRVTWANKDPTARSTQTFQQSNVQPELVRIQAKLRQSEKQVESLKSELDLYKHLLADSPKVSGSSDSAILKEHLEEIRALRKRLEESINVNDRLQEQLEAKLAELSNGGGDTSVIIYQSNLELTEENKLLKERLHEKDLKFQELVEELKKNKRHLQKLKAQNQQLSEQLQENVDLVGSLKFELNVLEQLQQRDAKSSSTSPGYIHIKDASGLDLSELLHEIRRLRVQLERSIETNNALRQKLEELMSDKWSPNSKTSTTTITINSKDKKRREELHLEDLYRDSRQNVSRQLFNGERESTKTGSPVKSRDTLRDTNPSFVHQSSSTSKRTQYRSTDDLMDQRSSPRQRDAGVGSSQPRSFHMQTFDADIPYDSTLYSSDELAPGQGRNLEKMYAIGTLPTYESLRAFLNESCGALNALEVHLKEKMAKGGMGKQPSVSGWSHSTQALRRHLEECAHYLSLFWTASIPPKDELSRLRRRLAYQDKVMKSTLKSLESTNRMKEGMEAAIYNQLTKTHDVLKQARGNLETRTFEADANGIMCSHSSNH
ncbi:myomegalin-like isoform X2 [Anneissia japonica]|uniref:myomegalin-like isoform X2 n=1 Tax=Anneissia japonica TaxID=1529436 RepID=UPI0014254D05|nr:myomegalin-like isoform X2 [Anneissia japonica]